MPYITDKVKIDCPFFDRRSKLLPCQKEMMQHYHGMGYSQRKLAAMFNVSRRLVQFITCPEKHVKNLNSRRDRGGSKAYYKGGEEWAATMRKHRRYKYNLLSDQIKQSKV
jgi:hypothetical protein